MIAGPAMRDASVRICAVCTIAVCTIAECTERCDATRLLLKTVNADDDDLILPQRFLQMSAMRGEVQMPASVRHRLFFRASSSSEVPTVPTAVVQNADAIVVEAYSPRNIEVDESFVPVFAHPFLDHEKREKAAGLHLTKRPQTDEELDWKSIFGNWSQSGFFLTISYDRESLFSQEGGTGSDFSEECVCRRVSSHFGEGEPLRTQFRDSLQTFRHEDVSWYCEHMSISQGVAAWEHIVDVPFASEKSMSVSLSLGGVVDVWTDGADISEEEVQETEAWARDMNALYFFVIVGPTALSPARRR